MIKKNLFVIALFALLAQNLWAGDFSDLKAVFENSRKNTSYRAFKRFLRDNNVSSAYNTRAIWVNKTKIFPVFNIAENIYLTKEFFEKNAPVLENLTAKEEGINIVSLASGPAVTESYILFALREKGIRVKNFVVVDPIYDGKYTRAQKYIPFIKGFRGQELAEQVHFFTSRDLSDFVDSMFNEVHFDILLIFEDNFAIPVKQGEQKFDDSYSTLSQNLVRIFTKIPFGIDARFTNEIKQKGFGRDGDFKKEGISLQSRFDIFTFFKKNDAHRLTRVQEKLESTLIDIFCKIDGFSYPHHLCAGKNTLGFHLHDTETHLCDEYFKTRNKCFQMENAFIVTPEKGEEETEDNKPLGPKDEISFTKMWDTFNKSPSRNTYPGCEWRSPIRNAFSTMKSVVSHAVKKNKTRAD